MIQIDIKNLGLVLGKGIFENLSVTINQGNRLAIIAPNGCGKTSLVKLIMGEIQANYGTISYASKLLIKAMQQNVPPDFLQLTLYECVASSLTADALSFESWRIDSTLHELEVPYEFWNKPMRALSGGWQRIALLAKASISEPDVFILDEPTNHLDISRIGIVQRWVKSRSHNTSFIIISHDRVFLDKITNRTLFLRPTDSIVYDLPYSHARAALSEYDAAKQRKFDNDMQKVKTLRTQAAKLKNIGINSGSDLLLQKTRQLNKRAETIEKTAIAGFQQKSAGRVSLSSSQMHAKALISIEEGAIATPNGTSLFKHRQIFMCKGDRIAILGANSTGKTTFLDAVINAIHTIHNASPQYESRSIAAAPSIRPAIADQHLSHLDSYDSPFEALKGEAEIDDQDAYNVLAGAGIAIDLQRQPLRNLSGGQRARLGFLIMRINKPNFYILDEPTNHLDIEGQEALEGELLDDAITALFVSHDRAFIRNVATRFLWIDTGAMREVGDAEAFFAKMLGG